MMPFGVDVLGTLTEKLKQLMNETQDNQRSFIDLTKLYREEKINEKDLFSKILNYVSAISALNFLTVRVILELRSALEKGTTIKDASGGGASSFSPPQSTGLGISGFISSVGELSQEHIVPTLNALNEVDLDHRKFEIRSPNTISTYKTCKKCGTELPIQAKFCTTCGKSQVNLPDLCD